MSGVSESSGISPSEMHFPPSALIKVLKFFKKTLLDQTASDSVSGDHTFAQLFCALHECWPRLLSLDLREKQAQMTETRIKWRRSYRPCAFVSITWSDFQNGGHHDETAQRKRFYGESFSFSGLCRLKTPWWVKILIMQIETDDMLCHCSWLQAKSHRN